MVPQPDNGRDQGSQWNWPSPALIAAAYAAVGGLWVVYSDALLATFATDPGTMGAWQTAKGIFFVAATAAVLYRVGRRAAAAHRRISSDLESSRRRQAEVLDALPDIVVTVDERGRITSWNRQALAATGFRPDEVADRSIVEFAMPEDRLRADQALANVLGGRRAEVRLRIRRGSGEAVPYHFVGVPLKNEDGAVRGAVLGGRDDSDRVRNEESLRRSLGGYHTILEQTIAAIAAHVEHRDQYLAGHQERVTELAIAIADRMGLDPHRRQGLRLASLCHDIGKIHVPAEILAKPGRISEAEFAIIKTHPEIGYRILNHIDFPWPIAKIVWQHHERWDGSGYPQGLAGEGILLEARILAVGDTVEAMMSHRPYRPGFGPEAALAEIEEGRGNRYDPAVADACLAVFRRDGFRFHPVETLRIAG